ncbi:MAG: ATP-binding protein [Spirochaetaceae bacterium]|nr:ATP-binding protein [Spirochaetaceae bacterium]
MQKEIPRWQAEGIKKALKSRRVVVLTGGRQTGKTTLLNQVLKKDSVLLSLDDDNLLKFAKEDPKGFIKHSTGTMFIDEVQKAPNLIPEIKMAVDKNNRVGQYCLTGSANIQTLPIITDSMAGRNKRIRLRPLTIGELMNRSPKFLKHSFNMDFPRKIEGYDKEQIFDFAFRGGYPEAVKLKTQKERKEWYKDYSSDLLNRDLKDLMNIRRQNNLKELVLVLAGWSGKFMDAAKIGAGMAISKQTLDAYINALESLFIFERVNPWVRTDYDRVGKSSKIYASDTGFMTSILGWNKDDIMRDSDRSGKLMETFIFQELAAQIDLDSDYNLFQYRDYKKHEVDFLIERDDGAMVGIEVKASHSVSREDFAPQIWFRENIIKGKTSYIALVLYSGEYTLSFGDGLLAVPAAALWMK